MEPSLPRPTGGLGAGTVRLAAGIEALEDLVADLRQGLDAARRATAARDRDAR